MDRLACVSVPHLSLQIAMKKYPDFRHEPAVIVDVHKPQGIVLEVNRAARTSRIVPGIRYAAALSLNSRVRAAVIDTSERHEAVEEMVEILKNFAPRFEVATQEPGVFWLDIRGLERLFGSLDVWSTQLYAALSELGFLASVVVGFSRFNTYALARAVRARVHHFKSPQDEQATVHKIPMDRIGLEPSAVDLLAKLGVETVGQFMNLPPGGIRERFSAQTAALHRMSRGELVWPLRPVHLEDAAERRVDFDDTEMDATRLLFVLKRELHPLLLDLSGRHQDLRVLHLSFHLSDHDTHQHLIRPARPTLDEARLIDLIRLKLERMLIPASLVAVSLRAEGIAIHRDQTRLFARSTRDIDAASHALARLQAEFGENCVMEIAPGEGHLPEDRFEFRPLFQVHLPEPRPGSSTAIRRIRFKPEPLHRFQNLPLQGWYVVGLDAGPIEESWGPFVLSTRWWGDDAPEREYHFARTRRGDLLWLYWDGVREQWFLHGDVE